MADLTCSTERLEGSDAVVVCAGEIDLYTSDQLKTVLAGVLREEPSSRLIVISRMSTSSTPRASACSSCTTGRPQSRRASS